MSNTVDDRYQGAGDVEAPGVECDSAQRACRRAIGNEVSQVRTGFGWDVLRDDTFEQHLLPARPQVERGDPTVGPGTDVHQHVPHRQAIG